jgi:hypothetical protein
MRSGIRTIGEIEPSDRELRDNPPPPNDLPMAENPPIDTRKL